MRIDYNWRPEPHLIPSLGDKPIDEISFDMVEDYIAEKLAEGERIRPAAAKGEPLTEELTDRRGRTNVLRNYS
jgi:hypothetical protein